MFYLRSWDLSTHLQKEGDEKSKIGTFFHALQTSEGSENLQRLKENSKALVSDWDGSGIVLEGPDERGELEEPQKHPRTERTKVPLRQSWTDQSNTGLLHRRQRPVSHMLIAWRKWLF